MGLILELRSVKIGGILAPNARSDAMSRLESLAFLWHRRAAKPILFEGVKAGCNVVLCGRRGTSCHFHVSANVSKIVLCGRRNTLAPLSEDDLQFSRQAQHCRLPSSFWVTCAAL